LTRPTNRAELRQAVAQRLTNGAPLECFSPEQQAHWLAEADRLLAGLDEFGALDGRLAP
jgi:hypothetical protein